MINIFFYVIYHLSLFIKRNVFCYDSNFYANIPDANKVPFGENAILYTELLCP